MDNLAKFDKFALGYVWGFFSILAKSVESSTQDQ